MNPLPGAISTFETKAIDRLKQAGFRITTPRVQVIRILAQSDRALSAYAIHELAIQQGGRLDIVSVYRTLATLVETHLVHHVGVVDGYLACGVDEHLDPMIEHLVCNQCGSVTEVPVQTEMMEGTRKSLEAHGFMPSTVKIEVLGTCQRCH